MVSATKSPNLHAGDKNKAGRGNRQGGYGIQFAHMVRIDISAIQMGSRFERERWREIRAGHGFGPLGDTADG